MKSRHIILAVVLGGISNGAWAGGFGISGKSASNLGNAFSGTAVLAEDASVVYTNPAAMQDMRGSHFSALLHTIGSNLKYTDKDSQHSNGSTISGPASTNVNDPHYVPNLYYVTELNGKTHFGFGVYSPFGLGLDYDDDWQGRYITTGSDMKIINFSPAISFQASDKLSLGVGVDLQYLHATLENAVDFGKLLGSPGAADGSQTLTGTNRAYGYSLGLTYDMSDATRVGMSFHSSTQHKIEGRSEFANVPALLQSTFTDTDASLTLNLPETLSLGIGHKLSPRLELMADATWTAWSRYDKLVIHFDNSIPTSRTIEDWNDTWRFSVGSNFRVNDRWLLRAGFSHDPTPIPDAKHRSPRVPGATRDWVSLGSNVILDKGIDVDLALSYTLPVSYKIDNTDSQGHNINGKYDSEILYVTAQVNWAF